MATKTHSANAIVKARKTRWAAVDVYVRKRFTRISIDSLIRLRIRISHYIDVYKSKSVISYSIDAFIPTRNETGHRVMAQTKARNKVFCKVSLFTKKTLKVNHSMDSMIG
jgi:hypothetical protein